MLPRINPIYDWLYDGYISQYRQAQIAYLKAKFEWKVSCVNLALIKERENRILSCPKTEKLEGNFYHPLAMYDIY